MTARERTEPDAPHPSSSPLLGPTPRLQTERLRLTPLHVDDASALAAAMRDPAIFTFIGGQPPMIDEVEARIRRYARGPSSSEEAWHNWAIRLGPGEGDAWRLIGHLQATVRKQGRSIEVAWLVGTQWQGRGYASEAAAALGEWLLQPGSGVLEVIAHIHPDNLASASVAARLDLQPTFVIHDGEVRWRREIATQPDARN